MSRPFLWMVIALAAAPAFAFLVYRLARDLGFLEPPIDRQHELRRTISLAIYAFLLFLPVLIYGFEKGWPRAWILFGILDGGALIFFAGSGAWAARELWRIRHPEPGLASETAPAPEGPGEALAAAPLAPTAVPSDVESPRALDEPLGPLDGR